MLPRLFRFVLVLLAVAVLMADGEAYAKKKKGGSKGQQQKQARLRALRAKETALRREIGKIQAQLPLTRQMFQSTQQQLATAQSSAFSLRSEIQIAKDKVDAVAENLQSIALHVDENQAEDSPLARAKAMYLENRQQCDALVESILNSAQYKAACQSIESSPDRGRLLAGLRKGWIDEKPEVVSARGRVALTKSAYERLQRELVAKDPEGAKLSDELTAARRHYGDLKNQLERTVRQYTTARAAFVRLRAGLTLLEAALRKDKADLAKVARGKKSAQSHSGKSHSSKR